MNPKTENKSERLRNYYLRLSNGKVVHYYGDLDRLLKLQLSKQKIDLNKIGCFGINALEKFNRKYIINEFTSMQVISKQEYNEECLNLIKKELGFIK